MTGRGLVTLCNMGCAGSLIRPNQPTTKGKNVPRSPKEPDTSAKVRCCQYLAPNLRKGVQHCIAGECLGNPRRPQLLTKTFAF